MKKDLIAVIQDVCLFTGRHLTQLKVLELDDAMYIDNFRKLSVQEKITEEDKETFGKFVRKGKVRDKLRKVCFIIF